ncbi:zinc finger protein 85-like isoform X1 [Centruroides vittatus]|uniref:zinc finger protein 85-like isoform X1 n=1 Tax=Centruroides vittatus TaxID=120091 RepID=UPI00350F2137
MEKMKIKEELETKYSDFTVERNEEKSEVDLKNFKKEFNTDVKCYKTIKSEPLEINIKGKPISTNNTNGSTIWSHSGYKVERDIKKEVKENYNVKYGIKSECKVVLKKLKFEVKTEDCKEVVHLPDDNDQVMINIKKEPISTNNTNGFSIWSHSGYKIETDIKKEEVKENYDVKYGIKSECKADLKKLKTEVKTEDCKEVVHFPDDDKHVMLINNEFLTSDKNFNRNETNIQIAEEEQIQKYDIQHNSEREKHFKYNIKRKKYVSSSRKCNKIHDKIKRKYFRIVFASRSKQEFTCDLCKQTFTNQKILQTHLFCHIGKKPFRCTTCNKKFLWQFLLRRHVKVHKTGNKNEISHRNLRLQASKDRVKSSPRNSKKCNINRKNAYCVNRGKHFRYGKGSLERHKRMHKVHVCKICGKEFKWNYTLLQHERTHSEDRPFKCDICNKGFKWMSRLKIHKITHSKERPFRCDICNKSFKLKGTLKSHHECHTDERNYVCQVCNKSFKRKVCLINHKIVHNDKFNHTCHICKKSFKRSLSLKMHIIIHSDEYKYPCDICNKYFKRKPYLRLHKLIHSKKSNIKRENVYCDICGKRIPYGKGRLEIHKRIHKVQVHACKICGKEFKSKNILLFHGARHSEIRPFKCDICNKSFKLRVQLKCHQKTHSEERPFKCDICNKGFKFKQKLKRHLEIHSDERNYSCQVCNKRFKAKHSLESHKVVHSDQFNYTCHICKKGFKRSCHLKRHINIHSDEYNYSCDICNKYFKTKQYLQKHKVIHRDR